jgi:hypothetical protein
MTTHSFAACPDCGEIAEISDRFVVASTDGPIEHARVLCVRQHFFMLAVASLDRWSVLTARHDQTRRPANPPVSTHDGDLDLTLPTG